MQKKNVSRVNVSLDNEFKGVLFDEVVYQNKLKVGMEISEYDFNKLVDESNMRFCKNEAFNYLARYIKTLKELKEHLYSKGYHKNAVDFAIENVIKYNLVDDRKYAESYYNSHKDNKSNTLIKQALKEKGVAEDIIDDVVVYKRDSELDLANKYVQKLARVEDNNITYKNLNRLKRQLVSRGISFDIINEVTSDFNVIYED